MKSSPRKQDEIGSGDDQNKDFPKQRKAGYDVCVPVQNITCKDVLTPWHMHVMTNPVLWQYCSCQTREVPVFL